MHLLEVPSISVYTLEVFRCRRSEIHVTLNDLPDMIKAVIFLVSALNHENFLDDLPIYSLLTRFELSNVELK